MKQLEEMQSLDWSYILNGFNRVYFVYKCNVPLSVCALRSNKPLN